jgi:hypothetical protein
VNGDWDLFCPAAGGARNVALFGVSNSSQLAILLVLVVRHTTGCGDWSLRNAAAPALVSVISCKSAVYAVAAVQQRELVWAAAACKQTPPLLIA